MKQITYDKLTSCKSDRGFLFLFIIVSMLLVLGIIFH